MTKVLLLSAVDSAESNIVSGFYFFYRKMRKNLPQKHVARGYDVRVRFVKGYIYESIGSFTISVFARYNRVPCSRYLP